MKKSIDNKSIGERIRLEREKMGLTREKLAEIVGLSSIYIGQLERGERQMSLDTLVKLSDCFNVSMDYFIKGEDWQYDIYKRQGVSLIDRCSEEEKSVIEDIAKAILPHIKKQK